MLMAEALYIAAVRRCRVLALDGVPLAEVAYSSRTQMAFLSTRSCIQPSAIDGDSCKGRGHEAGRARLSLAAGEPDFDTPLNVREAAIRAMAEGKTRYTNVDGIPELKAAVGAQVQARQRPQRQRRQSSWSLRAASRSSSMRWWRRSTRATKWSMPVPYWVSYPEIVRLCDAKPVFAVADASTGFKLTPEVLEAAITPKTEVADPQHAVEPDGRRLYGRRAARAGRRAAAASAGAHPHRRYL